MWEVWILCSMSWRASSISLLALPSAHQSLRAKSRGEKGPRLAGNGAIKLCQANRQHLPARVDWSLTHCSELGHESPSTSCSAAAWPASGVHRPGGCSAVCVCVCMCVCVSACLHTVWMSSSVGRGVCLRDRGEEKEEGGCGGVVSYEGWSASRNVSKLYSFSIKKKTPKWNRRKKTVYSFTCHSMKKMQVSTVLGRVRDATVWASVCQAALQRFEWVHHETCLDVSFRDQTNLFIHFSTSVSLSLSVTLACWLSLCVFVSLKYRKSSPTLLLSLPLISFSSRRCDNRVLFTSSPGSVLIVCAAL